MKDPQAVKINTSDLMTVDQAARELGVHFSTVYRWMQNGRLSKLKMGSYFFVPTAEVERLKKERAKDGPD